MKKVHFELKKKVVRECNNCMWCIPLGEGDHICYEGPVPMIVLMEYEPTSDYRHCQGTQWSPIGGKK